MSGRGVAIDLGTASTRMIRQGSGLVFDEPSVAAVDMNSGRLLAYGVSALRMQGRAAGRVRIVRPIRRGQVVDLDLAKAVLRHLLERAGAGRLSRMPVVVCVPGGATGVQRRAVEQGLRDGGARHIVLLDHAIAVAVGARLPIQEPAGSVVVDVGAGTTEVGILALGAAAVSVTAPVGGDDIDDAIRLRCQRELDLVLDRATAEQVKIAIASAWGPSEEAKAEVRGRDLSSGSVRTVVLSRMELFDVIEEQIRQIVSGIVRAIQSAPLDLANDLLHRGLHLAGGSAALEGLPDRLAAETGLPVRVVADPPHCAVIGAARCL